MSGLMDTHLFIELILFIIYCVQLYLLELFNVFNV